MKVTIEIPVGECKDSPMLAEILRSVAKRHDTINEGDILGGAIIVVPEIGLVRCSVEGN